MKGRTLQFSTGRYGGFYTNRGYGWRLCLGWFAITYWAADIDDILEAGLKAMGHEPTWEQYG